VQGRHVVAFTNSEEAAAGLADVVPFLLQTRLEERGAQHTRGRPTSRRTWSPTKRITRPGGGDLTVQSRRADDDQRPGRLFAGHNEAVRAISGHEHERNAFWDLRFADLPLEDLIGLLARQDDSGAVSALAVGAPAGEQDLVFEPDQAITVTVLATPNVFPGTHVNASLIIVDAARLGQIGEGADLRTEFWTRGAAGPVLDQLDAQQVRVFTVFDRDRVFLVANFLGVSFTFGYLGALAAFIAVIGLAGPLLYVETRQRARTAAYVFARRMGLSRRPHASAIRRELGVLLGVGIAVGGALAAVAIAISYQRFDIDPARPPTQLLTMPLPSYALGLAGAIAVTIAVSAYAQRVTDKADESAVLRRLAE